MDHKDMNTGTAGQGEAERARGVGRRKAKGNMYDRFDGAKTEILAGE